MPAPSPGRRNCRGGAEPQVESIAEFDPDTCTYVFATHRFDEFKAWYRQSHGRDYERRARKPTGEAGGPNSSSASSNYSTSASTREVQVPGGGLPGASQSGSQQTCQATIGWDQTAWQDITTEDPINIDVSSSSHDMFYFYQHGTCVNYVWSYLQSKVFALSGWTIQTHYHPDPQPLYSWKAVAVMPQQTMRNTFFAPQVCPLPGQGNTYTYYNNWLTAWDDGYTSYLWQGYSEGGCASWLSTWRVFGT